MNKIALSLLCVFISSVSLVSAAVSSDNFSFTRNIYVVEEGLRAAVTITPRNLQEKAILTIKVEGGSAVAGGDFLLPGTGGLFSIPFESGDTTGKSFSVLIKSDALVETNESFKVSIIKINSTTLVTPITATISVKDPISKNTSVSGTVKETTTASSMRVEVDKTAVAQNEMFQVTISGLPSRYFTTGGLLRFSRVGAPSTSCENASRSDLCQVAVGISCGILPKYIGVNASQWYADAGGKMEFVCYYNGENNNRNGALSVSATDQTYVVKAIAPASVPYSNGGITPPMVSVNTANIIVKGNSVAATQMTNYNGCGEGKGLNPYEIFRGCMECKYLPENWRATLSTCQNMTPEVYTWSSHKRGSLFEKYGSCGSPRSGTCSKGALPCEISTSQTDPNGIIYVCTSDFKGSVTGTVVGIDGRPIQGVQVTSPFIGYGGGSNVAITDAQGKFILDAMITSLNPFLNFKKDGYISDSVLAVSGENKTFTLRPAVATGQTELCPLNVIRGTLGNRECNCPNGSTKQFIQGGFICETATSGGGAVSTTGPLSITPSVGYFDPIAKNTLVFTITNAQNYDLEACYDAAGSSIGTGYCASSNNYFDFGNGNADWKFEGDKFVGRLKYDQSTWGDGGIKTVSYFRKKSSPNTIVTATIEVLEPVNTTIDNRSSETGFFGGITNPNIIDFDVAQWWKRIINVFQ